jgi:hypothetical protein
MNDIDESRSTTERNPSAASEMIPSEPLAESSEIPHRKPPQQNAAVSPLTDDSIAVPAQKPRRKIWNAVAIALTCLVVVAAGTAAAFYFKYKTDALNIVSSIEQRDAKLTERSKNALAISTNLKFSDAMAETDAVISERSTLIHEIEQDRVRLFQGKLDTVKGALIAENDQLGKDQVDGLRKELEPLVQQDNVSLGDVFLIESDTSTLSWNEAFATVDKNVADRVTLINTVKLMPPLDYVNTLSGYVTLLGAENDFCRTYGRYLRNLFSLSTEIDYYNSSYYASYSDVVSAREDAAAALKEFDSKYTALLKQDKAFWPTATAILPTRDLQSALAQFYKDVNGTSGTGKT